MSKSPCNQHKNVGVIENIHKRRIIKSRVFAIKLYFDQIFISRNSRSIFYFASFEMAHSDLCLMCFRLDRSSLSRFKWWTHKKSKEIYVHSLSKFIRMKEHHRIELSHKKADVAISNKKCSLFCWIERLHGKVVTAAWRVKLELIYLISKLLLFKRTFADRFLLSIMIVFRDSTPSSHWICIAKPS